MTWECVEHEKYYLPQYEFQRLYSQPLLEPEPFQGRKYEEIVEEQVRVKKKKSACSLLFILGFRLYVKNQAGKPAWIMGNPYQF